MGSMREPMARLGVEKVSETTDKTLLLPGRDKARPGTNRVEGTA